MKTFFSALQKSFGVLTLTLFLANSAHAQLNNERDMNFHFGVKGGVNVSNLYFNDRLDDNNSKVGFMAGVFVRKPFGTIFGIQPEVLFMNQGAKLGYTNSLFGKRTGTLNLNYVQVPVLFRVSPLPFISLHAGPYASYLFNANVSKDQFTIDGSSGQSQYDLNTDAFQQIDYGLAGGAELNLGIIDVGARYNLGMRKVGRSDEARRFTGNGYNQNLSLYLALVF